ncbi:hypothetical protein KUV89_12000 [Marinobacter hydrocarbonoclasticus]|nr:hypothetical protein [Marinobacter nauticus]
MSLNATLIGQVIFAWVVLSGVAGYWLARRKTHHPVIVGVISALTGLIPPLSLVVLLVLALKKEIHSPQ